MIDMNLKTELNLKQNTSHRETTFLDFNLFINKGQIKASLSHKSNSYYFKVVRFPHKISTIPS